MSKSRAAVVPCLWGLSVCCVLGFFPWFSSRLLAEESEKPAAQQAGENIALGKKYTLSPRPTYQHCTDPDDAIQLTDGKTTTGYFWTQKGTVGWQSVPYALVQIDLENVEPIGGIDLTTAAGVAGVTWPLAVFVHTSEDGKTFHQVGELVAADLQSQGPWPEGYAIRCLEARNLKARGRFVRFVLMGSGSFLFTDEIRIFRGDKTLLEGEMPGKIVPTDARAFFEGEKMLLMLRRRFDADVAAIRKIVTEIPGTAPGEREKMLARIDAAEKSFVETPESRSFPGTDPESFRKFKAILPYSDLHSELFRIQAALWKDAGIDWHAEAVSPWEMTPLFAVPSKAKGDGVLETLEVHAMSGEYRAAAVNLYNASQEPMVVAVHVEGIPVTEYTVHDVPWTDTNQLKPVLAALPFASGKNGVATITVLPGLVKQVYLNFRPTTLPAKTHEAAVVLQKLGETPDVRRIPLALTVWPLKFPEKTSLLLGGWSYTDGKGAYSVNPKNRDSFLAHLKEHYVNAPWARPSVVMNFKLDRQAGTVEPDTREWDDWLAQWPDAKEYCIFLSVGPSIGGVKFDEPDFDAFVARWADTWVRHWKTQGIEPGRINLLVADEPGLGFALDALYAWSRAIRKAQPELKLWTDPVYTDLSKAPEELFEISDIICPNRPQWLTHHNAFDTFYIDRWQAGGKTLQLYSCSGPARLLDPYSYYRLQPWDVARIHGTGSFFWAFGDGGGASSWNEYLTPRNMYTPLFIDPEDAQVVAGKQMEAVREGVQDYETIQMLRQAIARHKAANEARDKAARDAVNEAIAEAETVLGGALKTVLEAENADKIDWDTAKDRTLADKARVRILEALRSLSELEKTKPSN